MDHQCSIDIVVQLDLLPVILVCFILLIYLPHINYLGIRVQFLNLFPVPVLIKDKLVLESVEGTVRCEVLLRVGVVVGWRVHHIKSES